MIHAGRIRTALVVLLLLATMAPVHLCALCQECSPARVVQAADHGMPACHGGRSYKGNDQGNEGNGVNEVKAPSCCEHSAAQPAEDARQGLVPHGAPPVLPPAVSSDPAAAVAQTVPAAFQAPDPPPLHAGVSLHTLHSVFLI